MSKHYLQNNRLSIEIVRFAQPKPISLLTLRQFCVQDSPIIFNRCWLLRYQINCCISCCTKCFFFISIGLPSFWRAQTVLIYFARNDNIEIYFDLIQFLKAAYNKTQFYSIDICFELRSQTTEMTRQSLLIRRKLSHIVWLRNFLTSFIYSGRAFRSIDKVIAQSRFVTHYKL